MTVNQRIHFPGAFGDRLAARLEAPPNPRAWALFAHCFTCSKDLRSAGWISRALVEADFGVLRFDFTGLGESEGDFADSNFSSNLDDLVKAADFLRQEQQAPQVLIGHSLGGTAVLAAAHWIPEARAIVTIAAPHDVSILRKEILPAEDEIAEDATEVFIGGRPFRIKKQLFRDLEKHDLSERIHQLGRALLVLHSPQDLTVSVDHAHRIFDAARHPKSFVALDGADHLLLRNEADSRFVARIVAGWASRYLVPPEIEATAREGVPGVVVVRGSDGYAQEIAAGRHHLRADEPLSVGGTDTGPNPYELLLATLGACTAITVRMYANRKQWALEAIEVELSHAKIHAEDCEHCETETGKIDRIEKIVRLDGDLDDDQHERLMQISHRCPVHRTLQSEVDIISREEH